MDETIEDRLAAVERALTDGDYDCSALAEGAASAERIADLEDDIEELTDRVAELEAATQALRGYVGNVRSVNSEVEQRADEALAKAETARRVATGTEPPRSSSEPTDTTAKRAGATTDRGVDGRDSPAERCERCERPVDRTDRDGSQSKSEPARSRLDELCDEGGFETRREELSRAAVGAEADGGRSLSTPEGDETPPGLLARIQDLV